MMAAIFLFICCHYLILEFTLNEIGEEYLDRIGKQQIHKQKEVPEKDEQQKQKSEEKEEQLKPLQLNPNKHWENAQGPQWPRLKVVTKPGKIDPLKHARVKAPKYLQLNINQVAEANYQQKSLRLKENPKTVQLAGVDDKPHPHQSGARVKSLNHAVYAVDVNAAAEPNHLSGDTHRNPTVQPPPGHPIHNEITSKNPRSEKQRQKVDNSQYVPMYDVYFIAIVAGCSVAGLVGIIVAAICWYRISLQGRLQKNAKAASDVDYPAYGVTGQNKERLPSPGDRKLAQSAQMYHYQHQKQQMIALEKANGEMKHDATDDDSEEENEEGDYTVYECPGLAPTGEMEVKNPLFNDDSTQMITSASELTNDFDQTSLAPGNHVDDQVGPSPQ